MTEAGKLSSAGPVVAALLALAACSSSQPIADVEGRPCTASSECADGESCVDGRCRDVSGGDAGPMGGDGGGCPSMALCGTPPVCCAAGQDCVEGRCLAGCESGVRCGEGLEACCDSGEVCVSGACRSPGDACGDSFDCAAGEFCEPTLGRCLPQDDPVSCTTDPVFGDFEVTEEWSTTEATIRPDCMDIVTAPAIVDLDGEPGGVPEIIGAFGCREGNSVSEWRNGALRALDGDTGRIRWTAEEAVNTRHQYAAGDVDGDGLPEVVALGAIEEGGGRVLLFEADGTLKWRSTAADGVTPLLVQGDNGAFALADLEGDGDVEIVHGAVVLDHEGRLAWSRDRGGLEGTNRGYGGGVNNWEVPGLNNYRQNVQGEGVFNAPDLRPIALEVLAAGCPDALVLRARILNEGSLGVPAGVRVAFYRGSVDDRGEPVGEASTAVPLLPGATTTVEITVPIEGEGPFAFTVVVDEEGASGSAGAITECDEADNATDIGDVTCDLVF